MIEMIEPLSQKVIDTCSGFARRVSLIYNQRDASCGKRTAVRAFNMSLFVMMACMAFMPLIAILLKLLFGRRSSTKAPAIGYGSLPLIGRWQGVLAFMLDPKGTFERGCREYRGGYFKIATHMGELTLVADQKKRAEYLSAREDVLSFRRYVHGFLQTEWVLEYGVAHREYHIPLVRTKLTPTIALSIPAMLSEVQYALNLLIENSEGDATPSCRLY